MRYEHYSRRHVNVSIPIPESYKDSFTLIRSDYFRHKGNVGNILKIILLAIRYEDFCFLLWHRLCSYRGFLFPITRYFNWRMTKKYGIQIGYKTKIGYGFYLGHGIGTVINEEAIIGNNVNMGHLTTIGSNKGTPAIIGDNVYIGPTTNIIEDVAIGEDSTIGAASVVLKDVPINCTVAGSPAKIISDKGHPEFIVNKWIQ